MIIDDKLLLAELDEIKGSRIYDHLQKLRADSLVRIQGSPTDRMANMATGEFAVINELIGHIDGAHDKLSEIYEKERGSKIPIGSTF